MNHAEGLLISSSILYKLYVDVTPALTSDKKRNIEWNHFCYII